MIKDLGDQKKTEFMLFSKKILLFKSPKDTGSRINTKYQGTLNVFYFIFYSFKDFIYLFLERGEGERKGGRETSMCGCPSHVPYWRPGPQPRHVP